MNKLLTIAVPLYKKVFLDRLDILIPQLTDEVKLVIINDNLNLDINKLIFNKYGDINSISIINNKVNLGLGTNLSNCFYYTDTKWMWLLGDDDTILENSVQIILDKIKQTDSVLIKFSYIHDKPNGVEYTNYKNKRISGLKNFINELDINNSDFNIGTMIFMSNSVFNIEKLKPYINVTFKNSFSYAPHFAIILEYLSNNARDSIELSKGKIVSNYYPEIEDKWTRFIVALGILNLQYMILNMDVKEYKKFIFVLYKFINFRFIFLELFIEGVNSEDFNKSKFIYKQLYENGLAKTGLWKEKLLYRFLYFIMDKPKVVFKVFDILKKINPKYDINLRVKAKGFNKKI